MRSLFLILFATFLTSCAGYRLGDATPTELRHIKQVSVPQFTNLTQKPRLGVLATNSLVDALTQEGTYSVGKASNATLIATVRTVEYRQFRANRFDTLQSDELTATVHIDWKLIEGETVLMKGTAKGAANFFTASNFKTAERNALPLATQRATQEIVTALTEGF